MDRPDIAWRETLGLVLRRRKLILSVLVSGVAIAILVSSFRKPVYRASAKLMVAPARALIKISPDANAGLSVDRITEQDLNSEVSLLTSVALVREVLERHRDRLGKSRRSGPVGLALAALRLPLRLPSVLYRSLHGVRPLSRFEKWVQESAADLSVEPVKKSNLIEVAYAHEDPSWAARFLNDLVAQHVGRRARHNLRSDARRFFQDQRQLLSDKLRGTEAARRIFLAREGIPLNAEQGTELKARLAEIDSELARSQTALAEGRARVGFLSREIRLHPRNKPGSPPLVESESTRLIRKRIVALELQRNELLSRFAPTSIKVVEVDRQINEAKDLLDTEKRHTAAVAGVNPAHQALDVDLVQTGARLAALEARVKALAAQRSDSLEILRRLERTASDRERLQQQVATAKAALLTYLKKEEEARFASALDESHILNVGIVEPADVPMAPEPSKAPMFVFFATMASFVLAVAAAFLLDRLDPTIKSADEAERLTGLSVLTEIPS